MPESSLLAKTRELLKSTHHSYLDIYKATGLTPFWLTGVSTGKTCNPSVNRIQHLYEFLAGKKLDL